MWRTCRWDRARVRHAYDAEEAQARKDALFEDQELVVHPPATPEPQTAAPVAPDDDKDTPPSARMEAVEAQNASQATPGSEPVIGATEAETIETDPEFIGEFSDADEAEGLREIEEENARTAASSVPYAAPVGLPSQAAQIDAAAGTASPLLGVVPAAAADSKLGWLMRRLRRD